MSLNKWLRFGWLMEHESIALAQDLAAEVRRWLHLNHPELL
jgi:hypothetical protein